MLTDPALNLSAMFGMPAKSPPATGTVVEGDTVMVGGVTLEVIDTPGHTPGGISLVGSGEEGPFVFAGDTLFAAGVGRTDFPGGDQNALLASIREKLLTLAPETIVYPGHGPRTTIGEEMRSNPFVGSG